MPGSAGSDVPGDRSRTSAPSAAGRRRPRRVSRPDRDNGPGHGKRRQGARRASQPRVHPLRRQPRRPRHPVAGRHRHLRHQLGALGGVPPRVPRADPAQSPSRREPRRAPADLAARQGTAWSTRRSSCSSERCSNGPDADQQPPDRALVARRPGVARGDRRPISCAQYEASGLTGRPIFWRQRPGAHHQRPAPFPRCRRHATARTEGARPVAAELSLRHVRRIGTCRVPVAGRSDRCRFAARQTASTSPTDGTIHVLDYKTGSSNKFPKLSEDNPGRAGNEAAARHLRPGGAAAPAAAQRRGGSQLLVRVDQGTVQADRVLRHAGGARPCQRHARHDRGRHRGAGCSLPSRPPSTSPIPRMRLL